MSRMTRAINNLEKKLDGISGCGGWLEDVIVPQINALADLVDILDKTTGERDLTVYGEMTEDVHAAAAIIANKFCHGFGKHAIEAWLLSEPEEE